MPIKVLVTGAAGFIGSHLCEHLISKGYEVTGIDCFDEFYSKSVKERNISGIINNPFFNFIIGDAGDRATLDKVKNKPDVIIHLAAKAGVQPSLLNPSGYIQTNIVVTNNILEWMKEKGIKKMLFASSSSVYGNSKIIPFNEEQLTEQPISPYAFTKKSCELMNYAYHQLYGFDIINLRFFTVYGERQRPDLAIHKFVKKIRDGQPIHLYGDGKTSRDYTYWLDTVTGISLALDFILNTNNVYESINLGNNHPIMLSELVQQIANAMNTVPSIVYEDKKSGDVDITYADITKANKLLGYSPQFDLSAGLNNFIKWFELNRENIYE